MNNEDKLSSYIDRLNSEKTPEEHKNPTDSSELDKMYSLVRQLRSLKEPAMPDEAFPDKMVQNVKKQILNERRKSKMHSYIAYASALAAILVFALIFNFAGPFNRTNVVYAMQKAFQNVKAYHGILKVTESNQLGSSATQLELEVWADRYGNYYVKELSGSQKGLITVNNGKSKWQIQPDKKEVAIFPSFPDPYRFGLDLEKEIEIAGNAVSTDNIGEGNVSGKAADIIKVTPKGGTPYDIWVDKATNLPLQKRTGMQNAVQYTTTYTKIDYLDKIPSDLISLNVPSGYKKIDTNPELIAGSMDEVSALVGFKPIEPKNIPREFILNSISVMNNKKIVKISYSSARTNILVLQEKANESFKPAPTAMIGKVGGNTAEIQSPIQDDTGIISGVPYGSQTDINSIRWQQNGYEYAVIGNASTDVLKSFVQGIAKDSENVEIPSKDTQQSDKPQVNVPYDIDTVKNEQKSVDGGHSPWELDPNYVTQVFVSLKISPQGISGDYPINYEDLKAIKNTGTEAVIQVSSQKTDITKVYLKKLVRQDSTGIWTVVGYDASGKK